MSTPKRKRPETDQSAPFKKQRLLKARQKLPIWSSRRDICELLRKSDVLVLSGETGSGKSTQIPQFLTDQKWCSRKIAITQPRRVAAVSLACRVAEEMNTPCGKKSPASKVGYSVRFDDSTSKSTKIKYLTEGMLLQEMLKDTTLAQYSCIIVDEVHERSINVDLILGVLKGLLRENTRKEPLKVIVMSATADVDNLAHFFSITSGAKPELDGVENSGSGKECDDHSHKNDQNLQVSKCHVEGRQYPVSISYLKEPADDYREAALQRIFLIHCKEAMPGDILVFMTGQEVIQGLQKTIEEVAERLTSEFPKILVLPLFAALPQSAQQRIFLPAPPYTRKVILSTNIAETSVTVPGVKFVIDSGKAKVKQFRNQLGLDSLLVKVISKSSADQRKGRAGREGPGQCYRLYTQESYEEMEKETKPEILRCDLSQAVLNLKARGADDVLNFPFLSPPTRGAMEKALVQLLQLGAIHREDSKITPLGRKMARLPLNPELGRVIVEAASQGCLAEVIDIVACLSVENIFLPTDTEEARESAQVARQNLSRRQGDHLTLLAAVQGYAAENSDRRRWSDDHLVSHRAMKSVMDVRKQLIAQCQSLLQSSSSSSPLPERGSSRSEAQEEAILKTFLYGFINNCALLCPDGTYKTIIGTHVVAIHPSSVLFGRKVEAIMYNEFVFTTKAYARGVSAVQLGWIKEILHKTVLMEEGGGEVSDKP